MASTFKIFQEGKQGKTIELTYYQDRYYLRIFLSDYPTYDSILQVSFIATNGSGLSEIVTLTGLTTLVTMSHSSTMRYDSKVAGVDTIINNGVGLKYRLNIKIYNAHHYMIGINMGFYSYYTTLNNMTPNCNNSSGDVLLNIYPSESVTFWGDFLQPERPYIKFTIENDAESVFSLSQEPSSPYIPGLSISRRLDSNENNYFTTTTSYENNMKELIYRY